MTGCTPARNFNRRFVVGLLGDLAETSASYDTACAAKRKDSATLTSSTIRVI
jgi:hypothetical protein